MTRTFSFFDFGFSRKSVMGAWIIVLGREGEMKGEDEVVERECLLFEAGEYADRGVTITEDDLREIAENTAAEIPVRIEHMRETPFDGALGVVTRVRAVGKQLWG